MYNGLVPAKGVGRSNTNTYISDMEYFNRRVKYNYTCNPGCVFYDERYIVKLYTSMLNDPDLTLDEAICFSICYQRSKDNMFGVKTQFFCRTSHLNVPLGTRREHVAKIFKSLIAKGYLVHGHNPHMPSRDKSMYVLGPKGKNYKVGTAYLPYLMDTFYITSAPMRERVVMAAMQYCHSVLEYKEVYGTELLRKLTGINAPTLRNYIKRLIANKHLQRRLITSTDSKDSFASALSPNCAYYAYSIPTNDDDTDKKVKAQNAQDDEAINKVVTRIAQIAHGECNINNFNEYNVDHMLDAGMWVFEHSHEDYNRLNQRANAIVLMACAPYDEAAWLRNKEAILEWVGASGSAISDVFALANDTYKRFGFARRNAWRLIRFIREHGNGFVGSRYDYDEEMMDNPRYSCQTA